MDKTIEESCKYDRAYVRVQQIIGDLKEQKKDDDEIALESSEWPDASFDLVIQDLQMICNVYNKESKRLWNLAEKNGEYKQENVENLANAVVQKAVEDYEIAISGAGNPSEKLLIELFADRNDNGEATFTKLKVSAILEQVRKGHEEFVKVAHRFGNAIIEETNEKRAKKKNDFQNNKFRCPMCGGGLYAEPRLNAWKIACTGCYLSETLRAKRKVKTRKVNL